MCEAGFEAAAKPRCSTLSTARPGRRKPSLRCAGSLQLLRGRWPSLRMSARRLLACRCVPRLALACAEPSLAERGARECSHRARVREWPFSPRARSLLLRSGRLCCPLTGCCTPRPCSASRLSRQPCSDINRSFSSAQPRYDSRLRRWRRISVQPTATRLLNSGHSW